MIIIFADSPRIAINPSKSPHIVSVGDQLFLFCIVMGHPIPAITWYNNNTVFPQQIGPFYPVPTLYPHTTKYTCEAVNKAGDASASIIVMVKSKTIYIGKVL